MDKKQGKLYKRVSFVTGQLLLFIVIYTVTNIYAY